MARRYVSIWFRHLTTDRLIRRQPQLKGVPFVLAAPERGRMVVKAASAAAEAQGIETGMVVADSRAVLPELQVYDDKPGQANKLLNALAEWCLRYTPVVAIDAPDGLMLEVSGCPHLWDGERPYLKDIVTRLRKYGYDVRAAMADTIGTAWAIARYGQVTPIIECGRQAEALLPLPVAALRLETLILERMRKLGLYQIGNIMHMPRAALRRRFGTGLLLRLDQALGREVEILQPIKPIEPYQERLPSMEPICTVTGIEIALKRLLGTLCQRLLKEGKGLRTGTFKAYRDDGKTQLITIGTNRACRNAERLFRLFELKIATIEPELGFELFVLEAPLVEDVSIEQERLWEGEANKDDMALAELLDMLASKMGPQTIHRYLPDEHYWPERCIKAANTLEEKPQTSWRTDSPRPVYLLPKPEAIVVTAPIPDYPPMLFHYKGALHRVARADGPERIEQEWWLEEGQHRDYYCVEDEAGARYWLFRLGHYSAGDPLWFIHGFFA